jgi:hypothetical protein
MIGVLIAAALALVGLCAAGIGVGRRRTRRGGGATGGGEGGVGDKRGKRRAYLLFSYLPLPFVVVDRTFLHVRGVGLQSQASALPFLMFVALSPPCNPRSLKEASRMFYQSRRLAVLLRQVGRHRSSRQLKSDLFLLYLECRHRY